MAANVQENKAPSPKGRAFRVALICVVAALLVAACVCAWLFLWPKPNPLAHEPGQMPNLAQLMNSGAKESGYIDDVEGLFVFNNTSTGFKTEDRSLSLWMCNDKDYGGWMLQAERSDNTTDSITYDAVWIPTFFEGYQSPVSEAAGGLPSSGMSLLVAESYYPEGFDDVDVNTVKDLLTSIGFDGGSLRLSDEARGMRSLSAAFAALTAENTDKKSEEFGVRYLISGTVKDSSGTEYPVSFHYQNGGLAAWAQLAEDDSKLQFIPEGERALLCVGNAEMTLDPISEDDGWIAVDADWKPWDQNMPNGDASDEDTAALLKGVYNSLAFIDEELDRGFKQFDDAYLTASYDQRALYAVEAYRNLEDIVGIYMPLDDYVMAGKIPESSPYYDELQMLIRLCSDLYSRATTLYNAWEIDAQYEDPVPHKDEILAVLHQDDNEQGINSYEADFDESYPQWTLQ